jgi:hypothetical protein
MKPIPSMKKAKSHAERMAILDAHLDLLHPNWRTLLPLVQEQDEALNRIVKISFDNLKDLSRKYRKRMDV